MAAALVCYRTRWRVGWALVLLLLAGEPLWEIGVHPSAVFLRAAIGPGQQVAVIPLLAAPVFRFLPQAVAVWIAWVMVSRGKAITAAPHGGE